MNTRDSQRKPPRTAWDTAGAGTAATQRRRGALSPYYAPLTPPRKPAPPRRSFGRWLLDVLASFVPGVSSPARQRRADSRDTRAANNAARTTRRAAPASSSAYERYYGTRPRNFAPSEDAFDGDDDDGGGGYDGGGFPPPPNGFAANPGARGTEDFAATAGAASDTGWVGVDLDGTLAQTTTWRGFEHIGPPVPLMLERVRHWLASGIRVKIFTARAAHPEAIPPIRRWLQENGLPDEIEITNAKDLSMIELWDDRAIQVLPNTGRPFLSASIVGRPSAPILPNEVENQTYQAPPAADTEDDEED